MEALEGIVSLGGTAVPVLLSGILDADANVAAGCAEALRQQRALSDAAVTAIVDDLRSVSPSPWTVWLAGHLPREHIASSIADLQDDNPTLHYAISLLWSFMENWIARNWDVAPFPVLPRGLTNAAT